MKKILLIALAIVMLVSLAACGGKKAEEQTAGGWKLQDSAALTDEARSAFDKAMEGLVGVNYTPVALLGTQVVSGTNYSILCEASVVYPGAQPYYSVVTVYRSTQDQAEILNIFNLDLGDIAESGEIRNGEAPQGQALGAWQVDRDGGIEVNGAVLHLASQVVSGTNHCVLCDGWTLTFAHQAPDGKVEIVKTVPLDIAALARPDEG